MLIFRAKTSNMTMICTNGPRAILHMTRRMGLHANLRIGLTYLSGAWQPSMCRRDDSLGTEGTWPRTLFLVILGHSDSLGR